MINQLQPPTLKVYIYPPPLQHLKYQMYIKDHKFNVCFCPAIIGWISPQVAPPYSTSL